MSIERAPIPSIPAYEGDARDYERRWWTLGVLCLSLLMIVVANASLNVALPTLSTDLHASSSSLQWIVDAYGLVFAGLLLTAGSLGDRFGRRLALNGGLVVFGLASLVAAFSGSAGALIAARAVMASGPRSSCRRRCRSSPTSSRPTSAPARSRSGPPSRASASPWAA